MAPSERITLVREDVAIGFALELDGHRKQFVLMLMDIYYPRSPQRPSHFEGATTDYAFFSAHFASTSSCFFFGSFRCSSQRNLKRGPFDRFLQPG